MIPRGLIAVSGLSKKAVGRKWAQNGIQGIRVILTSGGGTGLLRTYLLWQTGLCPIAVNGPEVGHGLKGEEGNTEKSDLKFFSQLKREG